MIFFGNLTKLFGFKKFKVRQLDHITLKKNHVYD